MKKWMLLMVLMSGTCFGQRFDNFAFQSVNSNLQPIAGARIRFFTDSGGTIAATTYTDGTLTTPCSSATPVVLAGTSSCVSNSDSLGNFGAWLYPGAYWFTETVNGIKHGPYPITVGASISTANTWTPLQTFNGGINSTTTSTSNFVDPNVFECGLNPSVNSTANQFCMTREMFDLTANTKNYSGQWVSGYSSSSHYGPGTINDIFGASGEAFNAGSGTATLVGGVVGTANCGGVAAGVPVQTPTNNGNCTNLRGGDFISKNISSGTVGAAAGVYVEGALNTNGGTITTNYGLLIADQTVGATNYSIFTGVGPVHFGDSVTTTSFSGFIGPRFTSLTAGHQARFGADAAIGAAFIIPDTATDFTYIGSAFRVISSQGLPAAVTGNAFFAGSVGGSVTGNLLLGDGSGLEYDFAKRTGSVTTVTHKFKDNGDIDLVTGGNYKINGSQISAANLSNGTTGTAGTAVVLATSPTLVTPVLGAATATSVTIGSNTVPVVASPTVGQAACIKAAGPPIQIGYCSTVVSAGGACTCN